ncbi:hypothetical protein P3L10_019617 [Capsicum annuum]
MKLLHIFLGLFIMALMSKAELSKVQKPPFGSSTCPVPNTMDVEWHAIIDVQLHLIKKLVYFIATNVANGVNVFHQEQMGIKGVVLAIIIATQKEEDQNVHKFYV